MNAIRDKLLTQPKYLDPRYLSVRKMIFICLHLGKWDISPEDKQSFGRAADPRQRRVAK